MKYDVAIIGSGPAGLTAGIYASRGKASTIIFEGSLPGGQLTTTTKVENWPGETSIYGAELMEKMRDQAKVCGSTLSQATVTAVDLSASPYKLTLDDGSTVEAESVIISTGSSHKKLGCPGEQEYWAKGVATCATCDAPFYGGKDVVVVGGGNTAVTEAEHLAKFAKKVTIVHILDKLSATDPIKEKLFTNPQVNFVYNATVTKILGDDTKVTSVMVQDQKTKQETELKTDGVFVAIGFSPNTKLFAGQVEIDQWGYLVLKGKTATSKPGVFAAGDVADFTYRQAITSAGMGCQAALDALTYLTNKHTA